MNRCNKDIEQGASMNKVSLTDKRVFGVFLKYTSLISAPLSILLLFIDISPDHKTGYAGFFLGTLFFAYLVTWIWSNTLNEINIVIEGSAVTIKVGDIFQQPGFKAIAFNEHFDTQVDNVIISDASLNGIFIKKHLDGTVTELDRHIERYDFEPDAIIPNNHLRNRRGKKRYQIGTICVYKDFLLTAFSKFDKNNKAFLTICDYLEFLMHFWNNVDNVYAQKDVTIPIFGSGITRIKNHKNISDEDLLKIILWTFRISQTRFKHPARLNIVIHKDKIDQINLLNLKTARYGI